MENSNYFFSLQNALILLIQLIFFRVESIAIADFMQSHFVFVKFPRTNSIGKNRCDTTRLCNTRKPYEILYDWICVQKKSESALHSVRIDGEPMNIS